MAPEIDLRAETRAERRRLGDLLSQLNESEWDTPSLCAGWRVREVAAHLTMPFRTSVPSLVWGLVSSRFSFNRYADRSARRDTARMSSRELVQALLDNIDNPWQPPGGGPVGALSHDVIHGLDITEPLGLPGPPAPRIAAVLDNTRPKNLAYFGVDLSGIQLEATDAPLRLGAGEPVTLPAKDILLIVTGRKPLPTITDAVHREPGH